MAWLVERAPVSKDAQKIAGNATDIDDLLKQLLAGGHAADALRVVAAALPPREGIWWAWAAATHAARLAGEAGAAPMVTEALAAAEQWIASPDDRTRRASWAASERVGMDTPAGCAAAAPFFASGSVGPADLVLIPPPAGIGTMMVATAVLLSAIADPAHFDAMAGAYVAQGLEII